MNIVAPLTPILERHLEMLRSVFPGATAAPSPGGATLISIPDVALPAGWNRQRTSVWFIAPVGYPMAPPDSFWTEPGVMLASGAPAKNAQQQVPPFTTGLLTWFSWHAQRWNHQLDTLLTFARIVQGRLARAE
jgi:hypothetical protein